MFISIFNRNEYWCNNYRGGSRAAATSKMECFVIIVNGFRPLTVITKRSILDVAAALDPPLHSFYNGDWNNEIFNSPVFFTPENCVRNQAPWATFSRHDDILKLGVWWVFLAQEAQSYIRPEFEETGRTFQGKRYEESIVRKFEWLVKQNGN